MPTQTLSHTSADRPIPSSVSPGGLRKIAWITTSRADAIRRATERALSAEFREGLAGRVNPYGDGRAVPRIIEALSTLPDRATLLRKRWPD